MVLSKALATMQQFTQQRNMGNFRHYEGSMKENDFRAFTIKGMKKNYAVLPLVAIISVAIIGMSSFIVYCGRTRVDVSFNRNNPQISESMDMMNPTRLKMRVVQQEYKPMPELAAALEASRGN